MGKVIIVNPSARGVRLKYLKKIELFKDVGFEPILTSSIYDLNEKIGKLVNDVPEIIGIFGGDGTLFHTLNVILEKLKSLPLLFYLPGGTFNTIGKNLGYMGDPFSIADRIAKGKFQEKKIETISIQTASFVKAGFIFTSGLPYRSMEQYYSGGEPTFWTGIKTALWPILSFFFPFLVKGNNYFNLPNMRVSVNGKFLWEGPTLTVTAATVSNLGLWISPFAERGEGFRVLASSVPLGLIMRNFFKVLAGKFSHPLHYNQRSKIVEIELEEGFLIDGEMFKVNTTEKIIIREGPVIKMAIPLI